MEAVKTKDTMLEEITQLKEFSAEAFRRIKLRMDKQWAEITGIGDRVRGRDQAKDIRLPTIRRRKESSASSQSENFFGPSSGRTFWTDGTEDTAEARVWYTKSLSQTSRV